MNEHKQMNQKYAEIFQILKETSAIRDAEILNIFTELHQSYYEGNFELFNEKFKEIKTYVQKGRAY